MNMTPQDAQAVKKVVLGCMKIMYDQKTFEFFKNGLVRDTPMPQKLAATAVGLVKLFNDRANGSVPRQVLLPAAAQLVLEVADFVEQSGLGKPTREEVAAAGKLLPDMILKTFPNPNQQTTQQPPDQVPAQPRGGLIGNAMNGGMGQNAMMGG